MVKLKLSKNMVEIPIIKKSDSIFIVKVVEDGDMFDYQYSNYSHAKQHYDNEKNAIIFEYVEGDYYFVESKMV
jgi:hypothetical protein